MSHVGVFFLCFFRFFPCGDVAERLMVQSVAAHAEVGGWGGQCVEFPPSLPPKPTVHSCGLRGETGTPAQLIEQLDI